MAPELDADITTPENEQDPIQYDGFDPELPSTQQMDVVPSEEIDEIERQEQLELQELLALAEPDYMMSQTDTNHQQDGYGDHLESPDFNDEEYDSIFIEFISESGDSSDSQDDSQDQDHIMDISAG